MKIKQVLTGRLLFPKASDTRRTPGREGLAEQGAHPSPAPPVLALALHRALHGDVTGAADHHRVRRVLEQLLFQGPLLVLLLIDLVEIRHPETLRPRTEGACPEAEAEIRAGEAAKAEGKSLPRAPRPRSSFCASRLRLQRRWGPAVGPPPPLPSAITTQCQHPAQGPTPSTSTAATAAAATQGNHSNSQSLPQREHPATTSRDFPGVPAGG